MSRSRTGRNPMMPAVDIWIVCDTCQTPWALRRNLLNGEWLWTRDCKHKQATWTAMDEKGPLPKESTTDSNSVGQDGVQE